MASVTFENPVINERVEEWTSANYDEKTRKEIQGLVEAGKTKELEDRFYKNLEFGTGGLRGLLGAGTNRMNSYIVGRATQGLANYVKQHADRPEPFRACIGHDCRNGSREFAEAAAAVLAANGFEVFLSPTLRPTPYISFLVRELNCHVGIMITASHNPKEYNGYKVFWDDGSQVVPPHDKGIIGEVTKIADDSMVEQGNFDDLVSKGRIKLMGEKEDRAFLDAVQTQQFDAELAKKTSLKIAYTPLHGAGGTLCPQALREWGFQHVFTEPEQMKPDGNFPTAASPNPEEGPALNRAIQLAKEKGCHLVLATDPDGDRLGIAVLHRGEYRLVTGNQLGALLADYILKKRKALGNLSSRYGVVSTIVSTTLTTDIAKDYGAETARGLTGFKWIAKTAREWEKQGIEFVYGTEESYGFTIGNYCRDKDGIVACCVVAEMAADAHSRGKSLLDCLYDLFLEYGVHYEWQRALVFPGIEGERKIKGMLDKIRTNPPREIDDSPVVRFTRLDTGEIFENGKPAGTSGLPKSDVFVFEMENGKKAIARPSGTEPKIKFYFFLVDKGDIEHPKDAEAVYKDMEEEQHPAFEAEVFKAFGVEV